MSDFLQTKTILISVLSLTWWIYSNDPTASFYFPETSFRTSLIWFYYPLILIACLQHLVPNSSPSSSLRKSVIMHMIIMTKFTSVIIYIIMYNHIDNPNQNTALIFSIINNTTCHTINHSQEWNKPTEFVSWLEAMLLLTTWFFKLLQRTSLQRDCPCSCFLLHKIFIITICVWAYLYHGCELYQCKSIFLWVDILTIWRLRQHLFMAWIWKYKQKKLISKHWVDSNFIFSSYAWLCVFHCSHRLVC